MGMQTGMGMGVRKEVGMGMGTVQSILHHTEQPAHSLPQTPISHPHTRPKGGFALQQQLDAVGLVVERPVVQRRVPILRHPVQRPPAQSQEQLSTSWGTLRCHPGWQWDAMGRTRSG